MSSIPKGYKKTEVGVIPEEWDVLDIDHITDKVGSGITPSGGSLCLLYTSPSPRD